MKTIGVVNLASDEYTKGFSGADIAGELQITIELYNNLLDRFSYHCIKLTGLVRNAGSIALARARIDGSGVNGLLITLEDVMQALKEMKS